MPQIIIYAKNVCPYCVQAKLLLKNKGVVFDEINIEHSPEELETMIQKSGGRMTVPQIFIDAQHIGGYDDLVALDKAGKLALLLAK